MKFLKQILIAVAMLAACVNARAQFDFFGPAVTFVAPIKTIIATDSNTVIDIHSATGIAKCDIFSCTNNGASTLTLSLFTSPDRTNWIPLQYGLATQSSTIVTNGYYGTGTPLATNFFNLPGTNTTPNASTAGFATPYYSPPILYTNTAAIALGSNVFSIGISLDDAQRYIQFAYTVTGGTNPTNTVGAVITAKR